MVEDEEAGAACFLIHFKNDGTSSLTLEGLHIEEKKLGSQWIYPRTCWTHSSRKKDGKTYIAFSETNAGTIPPGSLATALEGSDEISCDL